MDYHKDYMISSPQLVPNPVLTVTPGAVAVASSSTVSTTPLAAISHVDLSPDVLADQPSDVKFALETMTINNLVPSVRRDVVLDLTCSINAGTPISHSLTAFGSGSLPAWVTFNAMDLVLIVVPPVVLTLTRYTFIVETVVNGNVVAPYQKVIYLDVNPLMIPVSPASAAPTA